MKLKGLTRLIENLIFLSGMIEVVEKNCSQFVGGKKYNMTEVKENKSRLCRTVGKVTACLKTGLRRNVSPVS